MLSENSQARMASYPRCWHCRSPAHGQCSWAPSPLKSHDSSSIRWLAEMMQRSRSIGLDMHTGNSRAENWKKKIVNNICTIQQVEIKMFNRQCNMLIWCKLIIPLWKAQQKSSLQSLWNWQIVPASPFVLFAHWPHTHSCPAQHSSSLVHVWGGMQNIHWVETAQMIPVHIIHAYLESNNSFFQDTEAQQCISRTLTMGFTPQTASFFKRSKLTVYLRLDVNRLSLYKR